MIGKSLTAADLSAYFQIKTLQLFDFDYKKYGNISKWLSMIGKIL